MNKVNQISEETIEETRKRFLVKLISSKVKKFPKGEDGLMLRNILREVEERFLGYDLFNMNIVELSELKIDELKVLIYNLIGLESSEDINKLSDKLVKYDYEIFFAPRLYEDLLIVEEKVRRLRELVETTLKFSMVNHEQYFDSLLEKIFEEKHDYIAKILGLRLEYKKQYKDAQKLFKDIIKRHIWPKYSDLIKRFILSIENKKNNAVREISNFNQARADFESSLKKNTTLKRILTMEEHKVA